MKLNRNKKGVSLVEIIIATSMLVVIISLALSLYLSGSRSFRNGVSRSEVQQNINLAANEITKELRYAIEVSIIDKPTVFSNDYRYIFINDSNLIEFRKNGSVKLIPETATEGINYSLAFENNSAGKMIKFSLNASGTQNYGVETVVLPLNMTSAVAGSSNKAIAYKVAVVN